MQSHKYMYQIDKTKGNLHKQKVRTLSFNSLTINKNRIK